MFVQSQELVQALTSSLLTHHYFSPHSAHLSSHLSTTLQQLNDSFYDLYVKYLDNIIPRIKEKSAEEKERLAELLQPKPSSGNVVRFKSTVGNNVKQIRQGSADFRR